MSTATTELAAIQEWLQERGYQPLELRVQDNVVVVQLPPEDQLRLLQEETLRGTLVELSKSLGFSRIALAL